MALIKYTPDNSRTANKNESTLRVNRNSAFSFSKGAAEALGLTDGTQIVLSYEDQEKEWYVIKEHGGFTARQKDVNKDVTFNCKALANLILDTCGIKDKAFTFKVATEPVKLDGGGGGHPCLHNSLSEAAGAASKLW